MCSRGGIYASMHGLDIFTNFTLGNERERERDRKRERERERGRERGIYILFWPEWEKFVGPG